VLDSLVGLSPAWAAVVLFGVVEAGGQHFRDLDAVRVDDDRDR